MRTLRKIAAFGLCLLLFAALLWGIFPRQLGEAAANLFAGGGLGTYFLPTEGEDGALYLLHTQRGRGNTLVGLRQDGQRFTLPLQEGLPEDYEVQSLYIAGNGDLVLSLYTRQGAWLEEYGLYASNGEGGFQLLASAPLAGATAPERRQSAGLLQAKSEDGRILLTVLQSGQCGRYAFSPQQGMGLEALEELDGEQVAQLAEQSRQRQQQMQRLAELSGLPVARATSLSPGREGGALLLLDGADLYRISANGAAEPLSQALYGSRWQSGLLLLAAALVAVALAYVCYYLVWGSKRVALPLALKHFLLLALVGCLGANLALGAWAAPNLRERVRSQVQGELLEQVQLAAGSAGSLQQAAQQVAGLGRAYGDVVVSRYTFTGEDWTLAEASSGADAFWLTPGRDPELQSRLEGAAAGQTSAFGVDGRGEPHYFAYAVTPEGELLEARVNARVFEGQLDSQIARMGGFALLAVGFVALLAALVLAGVSRGVKRAIQGIGLIAQGASQVRVVQQSRDELEALAAAVNDLSTQEEAWQRAGSSRGEAYLRVVPQRLVSLLGVSDIKQVDKNTTASHEMAVLAVRFAIPQSSYQRGAQALFDDINQVFSYVARPVSAAGGAIYSFTYDGFDAVFEGGIPPAVGAAVAVRQALLEMNAQRETQGLGPVKLRVALDYGPVLLGIVGDEDRVVPTIVSDSLNTARRLVALAPSLDANILCTALVANAASEYAMRYIGKCREDSRELRVYEIYDGDNFETRQAKESSRAVFSAGIYAFYSGDFSQAKRQFMEIARRPGEDGVALHYLYLADRYEKQPPDGEVALG